MLFGTFYEMARRGLLLYNGQFETGYRLVHFGLAAALCAGLPWVPAARKRRVLLGASLLVGASLLGLLLAVPVLMAWLASRVSRAAWSTSVKLGLLLGIWVLVPVATWPVRPHLRLRYDELSMYWSTVFASVVCLVVERARGQLEGVEPLDEWLYLLVFPRFFIPFLQPIGVRRFVDSWHERASSRVALRGLALGLYSVLGYFAIRYTIYALKSPLAPFNIMTHGPQILTNGVRIYAFNATIIFSAVALLRLVGYDLGSGFHYPLLATSVADVYRRWNYYLFEYATSMFYLPLVTHLRRVLPVRLAYLVAGYASVLLGVWALFNVIAMWPLGQYGVQMWSSMRDGKALLGYFGVWSLIILPQALLAPLRRLRRFRWWKVSSHILTIGTGLALATYAFVNGITVY